MKYISLLRGINVSGKNKIKMADLRLLYQRLGLGDVVSYIQSGNVAFSSDECQIDVLEEKIKTQIQDEYGYDVKIVIRQAADIQKVIDENPFLHDGRSEDTKFLSIGFMATTPESDLVDAIKDFVYKEDEFIIDGNIIYFFLPGGTGRTKLTNNFFERKLKVNCTSRNWRTVLKLREMLS